MRPSTRTIGIRLAAALVAALLLTAPRAARAQDAVVVDPGMTRAQVLERLGQPSGERRAGRHTYLFFRNGCERSCGMHDLVVLEDDGVTDAIFRAPGRRYTGESSSPRQVPPDGRAAGRPATATGSRTAPRARRAAARPAADTSAPTRPVRLPGARGGIVTGGDITGGADSTARRSTRAAGAAAAPATTGTDSARNARVRTLPGPARVPITPGDTQIGPPPRERGQRTLPGPVRVPTLPQDTTVRPRQDSVKPPPKP